jgi:hypothetical protein
MDDARYKQEVSWARVAVLAGMVLAVTLCGWNEILIYAWVPQGLLLLLMSLLGARPAAIGGAAIALAVFLGCFAWWVRTYAENDGMAWLLYLFSLPGGVLAGIAAALRINKRDARPPINAGVAAATWLIAGIAINHLSWYVVLAS